MLKPWAVLFRATCTQHSLIEKNKYRKMALYWRKLDKHFFLKKMSLHWPWQLHRLCSFLFEFLRDTHILWQSENILCGSHHKQPSNSEPNTRSCFTCKSFEMRSCYDFLLVLATKILTPRRSVHVLTTFGIQKSISFYLLFLNQHIWCIISLKHYNNRHTMALSLLWLAV